MIQNEIQDIEQEIVRLRDKLVELRRIADTPKEVPNYTFETVHGSVALASFFADKEVLFAIHNMGQRCRYCTLWADGLNGFLPHLEDRFSVVLLSKDTAEVQQRFAHSRGWRFRMASHGGGAYMAEQSVTPGEPDMPGLVCYQKVGDKIFRKAAAEFGPGDLFCGIWHILALAGIGTNDWTPQYSYWKRPTVEMMEDGGQDYPTRVNPSCCEPATTPPSSCCS